MSPFDPPENIRKPKIFWCFQGDQTGTLGKKELMLMERKNLLGGLTLNIYIDLSLIKL